MTMTHKTLNASFAPVVVCPCPGPFQILLRYSSCRKFSHFVQQPAPQVQYVEQPMPQVQYVEQPMPQVQYVEQPMPLPMPQVQYVEQPMPPPMPQVQYVQQPMPQPQFAPVSQFPPPMGEHLCVNVCETDHSFWYHAFLEILCCLVLKI
jgi:hypothetical protein